MERQLLEIGIALFGDPDRDKKGLVDQVDSLVESAERGRWAWKTVLWLGGGIVALLTAVAQLRTALSGIFGH